MGITPSSFFIAFPLNSFKIKSVHSIRTVLVSTKDQFSKTKLLISLQVIRIFRFTHVYPPTCGTFAVALVAIAIVPRKISEISQFAGDTWSDFQYLHKFAFNLVESSFTHTFFEFPHNKQAFWLYCLPFLPLSTFFCA